MTISSSAASRRYLEKSSFTSASATALGAAFARALLVEPSLRLLFRDDGEDLDLRFSNVIKHPDVINAKPVLRLAQAAEPLDSALAHLCRLVPQMPLDRVLHACTNRRRQPLQSRNSFRREDDLISQSGQILARIIAASLLRPQSVPKLFPNES